MEYKKSRFVVDIFHMSISLLENIDKQTFPSRISQWTTSASHFPEWN